MDNQIKQYLQSMKHLCPELKDEMLNNFGKQLSTQKCPGKYEIFGFNEYHNAIAYVIDGLVRSFYITPNGNDKTAWFIKKNEFVTDYPAFLTATKSKYIFESVVPTTLVFLPKTAINEFYEEDIDNQKYGRLIAELIIQRLQKRSESFLFLTAKERYQNFQNENETIINQISVSDMASLIGIERQSLTRIRKQLLSEK
jgi:CRP/FNR family transcriptional regulator